MLVLKKNLISKTRGEKDEKFKIFNCLCCFQLTYAYLGDSISFTANGSIGWADYDKKNPIYGKTSNDDIYGLQGSIFYKNPWNWSLFGSKPMNFYIESAYAYSNANIDFYDQQAFIATAGVFFKW